MASTPPRAPLEHFHRAPLESPAALANDSQISEYHPSLQLVSFPEANQFENKSGTAVGFKQHQEIAQKSRKRLCPDNLS